MDNFEIGQNSIDVCKLIVKKHPEIQSVKIIAHKVERNWRQKYRTDRDKLKRITDSLLHSKPVKIKILNRNQFLNLELSNLENLKNNEVWSMTSVVSCANGKQYHIPMMNFHPYRKNLSEIEKSVKIICKEYKGVILDSGRYFHYYGNALLTNEEWTKFIADFLMPCILVSPRYIGHRLNDGYCSLRLTTDKKYKTKTPRVVSVLNR